MSTRKNMESCCPCILESYDENDVLLSESIACTDCGVGWFKKYYSNGKLKLTGQYKENPTNNWDDIWRRGYCQVRVGEWKFYNENGERLYSEFWNDGVFLKQVPEQPIAELWEVFLNLNGIKIDTQKVSIDEIRNIEIIPKYKNSNTNLDLVIRFEITAVGYPIFKKDFSLKTFKDIDVHKMLSELGIPKEEETNFTLSVSDNKKYVRWYSLKVIK